jgi:hypothetical protein
MIDVLKTLEKLPVECGSRDLKTDAPILIRRGVMGFWPMPPRFDPDRFNEEHGISPAQVEAMQIGSMFGWDCPGADPDHEINQKESK